MARRRRPHELRAPAPDELPPELAAGPCIEDWCTGTPPDYQRHEPQWPAMRARRRWAEAVDQWALDTGWAREDRPAMTARNLARTRRPWSRVFLIGNGEGDRVDYLEGRRADCPPRPRPGWSPDY